MNYEQKREIAEQNLEPWFADVYADGPHPDETFISEVGFEISPSDHQSARNLVLDMVQWVKRRGPDEKTLEEFKERAASYFWLLAHGALADSITWCEDKGMFEPRADWDEVMADQALKHIKEDAA